MKNIKRTKQILAWIAIVLLLAMYGITFVLALLDSPMAQTLFRGSFYMTIMVPFLLYAFMLLYRVLNRNKEESADEEPGTTQKEDRKR